MSPAVTVTAWSQALSRAALHARVAVSVLRRDLSPSGWLGIALVGLSVVGAVAASRIKDEAAGIAAEAERLRSDSRRAALVRARVARTEPEKLSARIEPVTLPAAPDRSSGPVLPAWVFEQAERQGLRLGAIEYRWNGKSNGVQRVDVAFNAVGQYLPTRQWLAQTLARIPHAQLAEMSFQRAATSEKDLEVRIVIAVHFGART